MFSSVGGSTRAAKDLGRPSGGPNDDYEKVRSDLRARAAAVPVHGLTPSRGAASTVVISSVRVAPLPKYPRGSLTQSLSLSAGRRQLTVRMRTGKLFAS